MSGKSVVSIVARLWNEGGRSICVLALPPVSITSPVASAAGEQPEDQETRGRKRMLTADQVTYIHEAYANLCLIVDWEKGKRDSLPFNWPYEPHTVFLQTHNNPRSRPSALGRLTKTEIYKWLGQQCGVSAHLIRETIQGRKTYK